MAVVHVHSSGSWFPRTEVTEGWCDAFQLRPSLRFIEVGPITRLAPFFGSATRICSGLFILYMADGLLQYCSHPLSGIIPKAVNDSIKPRVGQHRDYLEHLKQRVRNTMSY